jgi:photosystem I subunit 10|uniref:PSI-K n=1 Tax=Cyanidiaceae sp. MX-AZ01 TaxID=1503164 RepID=A0A060ADU0_9RHOD|nr:photosystem I reaction center subunit X [Cyanidiaceae sp. MX-AZ01]
MIQYSSSIPVIMVACNLLGIAIARYANPSAGLNLAQLLAAASLGHVIGVGTVLGLSNMGVI